MNYGLEQLSELCDIKIIGDPAITHVLRDSASHGTASADQILAEIPLQSEPKILAQAAILSSLTTISFASRPELAEEIVLHAALTSRKGFTEYAPYCWSVWMMFKHEQGSHDEANTIAEVTEALLHKIGSP